MTKVLSANFMRLKKDNVFWIGLVFMFAAGIFFPVIRNPLCPFHDSVLIIDLILYHRQSEKKCR